MSRYIDADALEKILAYWIEEKGYARKKHSEEFVEGMEDAYRRVLCFVKMEPKAEVVAKNATSDVRENVHAHWEGDGQPTAQPERKTGKWIWMGDKGDSRFMCSVCKGKENVPTIMGKPTVWDYCPNCGAEMEGR